MQEQHWERLIRRITKDVECTPIIGPDVNQGLLPSRIELARKWAQEYSYPLANDSSLVHVSKFLSVADYKLSPHDKMRDEIGRVAPPDFTQPNQPHALLAGLNLPLYITTNYDDFLFQALEKRPSRPEKAICRWNSQLVNRYPPLSVDFKPGVVTPLVYHLYGHVDTPDSMVVHQDDCLDFLVNMANNTDEWLPPPIMTAMSATSLLFIGYDPTDWDFWVLLRSIVKTTDSSLRRISVTAQFPLPEDTPEAAQAQAQTYMGKYMQEVDDEIQLFWGTAQEFLVELHQRINQGAVAAATVPAAPGINQAALFHKMKEYFSKEDLINLAFEMGIDHQNLPEAKNSFARELILEAKNRKRLEELVELCRRERPQIEW